MALRGEHVNRDLAMHKAIRLAVVAAIGVVVIGPILIVAVYQAFNVLLGGGRSRLPPVTASDVAVKNKCRLAAEQYLTDNSPDGWFEIVREPNQNVPLQRVDGWCCQSRCRSARLLSREPEGENAKISGLD